LNSSDLKLEPEGERRRRRRRRRRRGRRSMRGPRRQLVSSSTIGLGQGQGDSS
jgi:hypothetical protein